MAGHSSHGCSVLMTLTRTHIHTFTSIVLGVQRGAMPLERSNRKVLCQAVLPSGNRLSVHMNMHRARRGPHRRLRMYDTILVHVEELKKTLKTLPWGERALRNAAWKLAPLLCSTGNYWTRSFGRLSTSSGRHPTGTLPSTEAVSKANELYYSFDILLESSANGL